MTYTYTGNGSQFIAGVPARDLTEAEFNALPQEQQDACIKSGLYALPAQPTKKVTKTEEATNG